jgi:hypothetical protein
MPVRHLARMIASAALALGVVGCAEEIGEDDEAQGAASSKTNATPGKVLFTGKTTIDAVIDARGGAYVLSDGALSFVNEPARGMVKDTPLASDVTRFDFDESALYYIKGIKEVVAAHLDGGNPRTIATASRDTFGYFGVGASARGAFVAEASPTGDRIILVDAAGGPQREIGRGNHDVIYRLWRHGEASFVGTQDGLIRVTDAGEVRTFFQGERFATQNVLRDADGILLAPVNAGGLYRLQANGEPQQLSPDREWLTPSSRGLITLASAATREELIRSVERIVRGGPNASGVTTPPTNASRAGKVVARRIQCERILRVIPYDDGDRLYCTAFNAGRESIVRYVLDPQLP